MIALANWAQHIVTFQGGAADFVMEEALIFKAHIFLDLTIFLIFPFTKLVHVFSAPIKYVLLRTSDASNAFLPFELAEDKIREYLHTRNIREGIRCYVLNLAGNARISGFDLAGSL